MAPRRSSRINRGTSEELTDDNASSIFRGPAVQTNLPPIPSRFSTAYGSDVTETRVLNTRRGERRTIQSVLDDILDADQSSDFGTPRPEPQPEDTPRQTSKRPSRQPPSKSGPETQPSPPKRPDTRPQPVLISTPIREPTREPLRVTTPTPRRTVPPRLSGVAPSKTPPKGPDTRQAVSPEESGEDSLIEREPVTSLISTVPASQSTPRSQHGDPRGFFGGVSTPGSSVMTYGEEKSLFGAGGVSHGGSSQASNTPVDRRTLPEDFHTGPSMAGYNAGTQPIKPNPFSYLPSSTGGAAIDQSKGLRLSQPHGVQPAPIANPRPPVKPVQSIRNPPHTQPPTGIPSSSEPPDIAANLPVQRPRNKPPIANPTRSPVKSTTSSNTNPKPTIEKHTGANKPPKKPAGSSTATVQAVNTTNPPPPAPPKKITHSTQPGSVRYPVLPTKAPTQTAPQPIKPGQRTVNSPPTAQPPAGPSEDAPDTEDDSGSYSDEDEDPQTWASWWASLSQWFQRHRGPGSGRDLDVHLGDGNDKDEDVEPPHDVDPGAMSPSQWLWHCIRECVLACHAWLRGVYLSLNRMAAHAWHLAFDTPLKWLLLSLGALFFAMILHSLYSPSRSVDGMWESDDEATSWSFHWHGWGLSDMTWNLGQLLPLSLARPSTLFASEEARAYEERLRNFNHEMHHLKASKDFHDESIAKLESLLPKIIYVDMDQQGRPRIKPDFYYALRELMKKDSQVFTFEADNAGYMHVPDEHWQAIKRKAGREDYLVRNNKTHVPAVPRAEIQQMIKSDAPNAWTEWAKSNKQKVADIVKHHLPLPDTPQSGSGEISSEMDRRIEEIALQYIARQGADENSSLITRRNFMFIIKEEFAKDHGHISHEALVLKDQAKSYVESLLKTTLEDNPALTGLSRDEVLGLVNSQVRKVIADAGIKAFADGKIAAEWDHDLRNRVNYFNPNLGAIVSSLTTPTYKPKEPAPGSFLKDRWRNHEGRRQPAPHPNAVEALLGWSDAGDCWCGTTTYSREGAPLGIALDVILGHRVKPEYLVVEHILPGATLAPAARPRAIELWVQLEEWNHRELVRDFAAYTWPSSLQQPFGESFVQVSSFEYESQAASGGVYVHKLPDELKGLNLSTDHVIVRPVTNYGDEEHTCLYRVRLYGENDDPTILGDS